MLSLIPSPIGNLEDISFRALELLKTAEFIFCEDTRVCKRLLHLLSQKFNMQFQEKIFKSLHSHNEKEVISSLDIALLKEKSVLYLSDAGMPCISDPGALLVDFCIKNKISYQVLPGASALLCAYAMSGFSQSQFTFFGFFEHKGKQRANMLSKAMQNDVVSIVYEAPHRLIKLLKELRDFDKDRIIFLVKELSKMYEKSYKASANELYENLKNTQIKGEWVVVIEDVKSKGEQINIQDINALELSNKQKAKLLSKLTGLSIKEEYNKLNQGENKC